MYPIIARSLPTGKCCIKVGECSIDIDVDDVKNVLGLPSKGREVILYSKLQKDDELHRSYEVKNWAISLGLSKDRLKNPVSDDDLKRSFVLFSLSTILCPSMRVDANPSFLPLLEDVNRIREFNWGKFVLDTLIINIRRYQEGTMKSVNGCLLFLQFLYFERVVVGDNIPIETTIPRIEAWTNDTMKKRESNERRLGGYGFGKIVEKRYVPTYDTELLHDITIKSEDLRRFQDNPDPIVQHHLGNMVAFANKFKSEYEMLTTYIGSRSSMHASSSNAHEQSPTTVEKIHDDANQPERSLSLIHGTDCADTVEVLASEHAKWPDRRTHRTNRGQSIRSPFVVWQRHPRLSRDEARVLKYVKQVDALEEILVNFGTAHVCRRELLCLRDGERVNSAVVHALGISLTKKQQLANAKGVTKHYLASYFSQMVLGAEYSLEHMEKCFFDDRQLGFHIVQCELIFIPVCHEEHWFLVIVNLKACRIELLDSFPPRRVDAYHKLVSQLAEALEKVYRTHNVQVPITQWEVVSVDVLHQTNGFDCGIFMLKFMELWDGNKLTHYFSQANIKYFRQKLLVDLVLHSANQAQSTMLDSI